MRQHILEQWIQRWIVDVRLQYAFFQIVQNDNTSNAAESTKRRLVQLGPGLRVRTEGE